MGHQVIGNRIYFIALVGFVVFYGMEYLLSRRREPMREAGNCALHIGINVVYNFLVVFTLTLQPPMTATLVPVFALSLGMHLMSTDGRLIEHYGPRFLQIGRYLLVLAGYAWSLVRRPYEVVVDVLTAFLVGMMLYGCSAKNCRIFRRRGMARSSQESAGSYFSTSNWGEVCARGLV